MKKRIIKSYINITINKKWIKPKGIATRTWTATKNKNSTKKEKCKKTPK